MGESKDTISTANTEPNLNPFNTSTPSTPSTPNLHDPSVLKSLADSLMQRGDLEGAISYFEQSIAIKPDDPEVHTILARTCGLVGRSDQAIDAYKKAIELKPDYAEAHTNLGRVLRQLGKREEACVSYRKALDINPLEKGARAGLEALEKALKPRPLTVREESGKAFAERLKHLLTYSEMNQTELAKGLKMRQSTLSAWLTGTIDASVEGGRRYRLPGRHRRGAVARYFNATWLIDGEGPAPTGKGFKPESGLVHGSSPTTVSPEGVSGTGSVGTVSIDPWDVIQRIQDEGWPVDVEKICHELGISLHRLQVSEVWSEATSDFCGSIAREGKGYEIIVNEYHPDMPQRFIIAHELAHFLEHKNMIGAEGHNDHITIRPGPHTKMDREANRLAAEILMPDKLLAKAEKWVETNASGGQDVEFWARKFGVSAFQMCNRLGIPY